MSDNLTLEQIETDLKKMNKDLSKLRGYVSAHRDEMCSLASTNQLNKQFSKYLPAGYAFKRNYNVLGIRAIAGRNSAPEEEKLKMSIKKRTNDLNVPDVSSSQPSRPKKVVKNTVMKKKSIMNDQNQKPSQKRTTKKPQESQTQSRTRRRTRS